MAQLPSISTKTYFTLIYSERSVRSDALIALCGPSIHHSEQEALRLLWVYVRNRIIDVDMVEEFLESVMGYEDGDMELTDEDAVPASMSGEQLKGAVNWYFGFMNDECCECFYQIDKHLVTEGMRGMISLDDVKSALAAGTLPAYLAQAEKEASHQKKLAKKMEARL